VDGKRAREDELMPQRDEALLWLAQNLTNAPEARIFKAIFAQELDVAIEKQGSTRTIWYLGRGLVKGDRFTQLRWDCGQLINVDMPQILPETDRIDELGFKRVEELLHGEVEQPDEVRQEYNNPQVAEYIDLAWDACTIFDEEQQLKEPTSRKQMEEVRHWLEKAKALKPDDDQSQGWIDELEEWADIWEKRHFDGSNKDRVAIVVFVILWAAVNIWTFFSPSETVSTAEKPPLDISAMVMGYLFWLSVISYFWTNRAPRWLIDNRNRRRRWRPADLVTGMANNFLGLNLVYETTLPGGRKERHDDAALSALPLILGFCVWGVYYGIFFTLLPLSTVIAYLRNYLMYK
jgi:hypothetical protein